MTPKPERRQPTLNLAGAALWLVLCLTYVGLNYYAWHNWQASAQRQQWWEERLEAQRQQVLAAQWSACITGENLTAAQLRRPGSIHQLDLLGCHLPWETATVCVTNTGELSCQ